MFENEKVEDKTTEQSIETVTPSEPASSGPKTTKEQIRDAIKVTREKEARAAPAKGTSEPKEKAAPDKAPEPKADGERPRDDAGRFTSTEQKSAVEAPKPATPASPEIPAVQPATAQPAAASKPAGPPTSWPQEAKAAFPTLPPAVQMAIAKREEEMDKGSKAHQDERNRFREIEQVIAPHRPSFQQAGIRSDAEAFKQLLDWRHALAGPNREHWFRELGRTIGINLSPQVQPQGQTEGQDQNQLPPAYARQLFDHIGSVDQRLNSVMSRIEAENNARVAQEIADFSRDKPHFERVKTSMGMLMKAASDANQPIDLNEAYDRAVWADRDLRAEMQAEAEQKRQQEAAAAAAKAAKDAEEKRKADELKRAAEAEAKRRASVSPKGSTPSARAANAARKPHSQSVRESILASKSEVEGRA